MVAHFDIRFYPNNFSKAFFQEIITNFNRSKIRIKVIVAINIARLYLSTVRGYVEIKITSFYDKYFRNDKFFEKKLANRLTAWLNSAHSRSNLFFLSE